MAGLFDFQTCVLFTFISCLGFLPIFPLLCAIFQFCQWKLSSDFIPRAGHCQGYLETVSHMARLSWKNTLMFSDLIHWTLWMSFGQLMTESWLESKSANNPSHLTPLCTSRTFVLLSLSHLGVFLAYLCLFHWARVTQFSEQIPQRVHLFNYV